MATDHPDEVAIDDSSHLTSISETMCLDLDNNTDSKDVGNSIETAKEHLLSHNEISESEQPILNGESKLDDVNDVNMEIQPSAETVSECLTIGSPLNSESHSVNGLDQLPATESKLFKIVENQETVSNIVADEDAIMESPKNDKDEAQFSTKLEPQEINSMEPETQMNSENIHGHLSDLEIDANQPDLTQGTEQTCDNSMALGDFFNETSEVSTEGAVVDSTKSPHLDQKMDTSPESKDESPITLGNSTKNPRENDSDLENLPSAKRLRTHENSDSETLTSKKNAKSEREIVSREADEENNRNNEVITPYQNKEIIKILRNISRTNSGKNFRQPVAVLWPSIADNYATKISHPMDLSTIEKKLKEDSYSSMNDLRADVHLIYNNSVIFNTAENPLSKCAMETRNTLFNKFSNIPPEPIPAVKKEKKTVKRSVPSSDLAIRPPIQKRSHKESIPSNPNTAQAFALDPATNTPLIRRDLAKADGGRPKREIHPPKNKDLPYAVRPKNKKHQLELKFCEEVLTELQKAKYTTISHPFMVPVDPVALGIPNYFAIIKKPMDISTVVRKLKDGVYLNANECEKDIRQIFINCYKYNPEGNPVREMGENFERIYNNLWAKKEQYIVDNTPSAASPSDRETEEESDDDDEALDGSSVSASLMSQKERLLEEQSKLITLMGAKHRDEGLLQMQTDLVELIQKRVKAAEEQARKALSKKKIPKPNKKAIPTKKAAPVKKAVAKKRYLGTLEKETISAGLGLIPAQVMATVVEMIKTERPELEDAGDETMELDIDSISDSILWQIHAMIMKHVPELEGQIRESMSSEPRQSTRTAKPAQKRKNKPMSKHEQERKIEALTNLDSEFAKATFGSQEPTIPESSNYANSPHLDVEAALDPESSGDEDSDSEEE